MENFNVLVLCQRKCSKVDKRVENTVINIKNFVKENFGRKNNFTYTFLSDGMITDTDHECIDVIMRFDMSTEKTVRWVKNNENFYDIIIINTCPFYWLPIEFWYGMWKVLSEKGKLFLTVFSSTRKLNITLNLTHGDSTLPPIRKLNPEILEFIHLLFDIDKENKILIRKDTNIDDAVCILLNNSDNLDKMFHFLPYDLQQFTLNISSHMINNKTEYKHCNIKLAKKILLKYN